METQSKERAATMLRIDAERGAQDRKWGQSDHSDLFWLALVGEEFGEAAKEVVELQSLEETAALQLAREEKNIPQFGETDWNAYHVAKKRREENLETELVQTAAVIVSWLESRARRRKK